MGSSVVGDLTGGLLGETSGERAARRGARQQMNAAGRAQDIVSEETAPFRQLGEFGAGQVPGAVLEGDFLPAQVTSQDVIADPFFQALAQEQDQRLLASAAARGRTGAGGTGNQLQQNLLLLGNQFREDERLRRQQTFQNRLAQNQQRFGQLLNLTSLGANAATGTATQLANLETGAASAGAAGRIGQANARLQAQEDLFGRAAQAATLGTGGAGLLGPIGAGATGAGLDQAISSGNIMSGIRDPFAPLNPPSLQQVQF